MKTKELDRDEIINGFHIWKNLLKEYCFDENALLIFCEYYEEQLLSTLDYVLAQIEDKKPYIITVNEDILFDNADVIRLDDEKYECLRKYYFTTVFHLGVRFISGRSPFGSLRLFYENGVDKQEYVRYGLLKQNK